MTFERIPTRRKPVRKTMYARLFNKTQPRRQLASASSATASPEDAAESGINISRSLTIIFGIHLLAIGMIFIHKQYLADRTPEPVATSAAKGLSSGKSMNTEPARKFSSGDVPYLVVAGDNFPKIAAKHNVEESELRNLNIGREIRAGALLRIPERKRIIAEEPPEVAAIKNRPAPSDSDNGLVEIVAPARGTQATVVRPVSAEALKEAPRASVVGSGRTHVLKAGENIWRISNKYKVSQKDLMSLNQISDPTKLKIGQVIKLP